jgi:hypothetical protein
MKFLKTREQLLAEKLGSLHESVFKHGDVYKVKTIIEVPKSVINQFVSKAKKENDIDPRENWSDVDLAEMIVNYVAANFITVESLPVGEILGEKVSGSEEKSTTVGPEDISDSSVSPEGELQGPAAQPAPDAVQAQPASADEPSGEIQPQ